jgi:hypothetical protein
VNNEQTVYDLKLEAIDNYLLVSGWTKVGPNKWRPPAQIALALRHHAPAWKTGTWSRANAVMIQVQADEAAIKETQARAKQRKGR